MDMEITAPAPRRRGTRVIQLERVGLKRLLNQKMSGVNAAQTQASRNVRMMGPTGVITRMAPKSRGSRIRLTEERTASEVQQMKMRKISREPIWRALDSEGRIGLGPMQAACPGRLAGSRRGVIGAAEGTESRAGSRLAPALHGRNTSPGRGRGGHFVQLVTEGCNSCRAGKRTLVPVVFLID
jgi:hypothetical protein